MIAFSVAIDHGSRIRSKALPSHVHKVLAQPVLLFGYSICLAPSLVRADVRVVTAAIIDWTKGKLAYLLLLLLLLLLPSLLLSSWLNDDDESSLLQVAYPLLLFAYCFGWDELLSCDDDEFFKAAASGDDIVLA